LNFTDEPERAYSILPKLTEPGTVQSLSNATGIVQIGHSFLKKRQNTPAVLGVESGEPLIRLGR
jgi:hypothetical protein